MVKLRVPLMLKQWAKPVPTTYKQGTKNLALNERGEMYTLFLEHEGYDYDKARRLFRVLGLGSFGYWS